LIMNHLRNFAIVALIALLSAAAVQPQESANTTTYFEKVGVQFDVPAGWNPTESELLDERIVTIQPEKGPAQIAVSTTMISGCDFPAQARQITAALVARVGRQIHSPGPGKFSVTKTQVNTEDLDGVSLPGTAEGNAVIADVYAFRVGLHFVSLLYIRARNDEAANSAWNTVRTTLKADPGSIVGTKAPNATGAAPAGSRRIISGGVLNGKALSLPAPSYPPIARQAHASGTVVVQVTIDESGGVVNAHAVSGHPLLQAVSVQAARDARFSPTKLCDIPVKVTGVITYRFVAQ
jgi:TonB family protein